MRALFRDGWEFLRKHAKALAVLAGLAAILVVALNFAASRVARRSGFCDT